MTINKMQTMKIQFKYTIMAAVAGIALGTVSCTENAIDDLQGIYAAPTKVTVTSGSMVDKTKDGNLRTFTMEFTSTEGVSIKMDMVASSYYLAGTTYSIKDASAVKHGNFVSGKSTVNGEMITDGSLSITQDGDNYTINKSTLFTTNGSYSVTGSFTCAFEVDDPTALSLKTSYDAMGNACQAVDNGNGTYTVTFTTGGYTEEFNWTTYSTDYSGEGNDLQVVFILPDGKLHEGTYKPGEGYVAGYSFMNDAYVAWGYPEFEDYAGTIWYSIANGVRVPASLITTGDIVVKKDGPLYTILLDQGKGGLFVQYEGALGELDPDGGSGAPIVMMNNVLGVSNYAALNWIGLIDIQLGNGTLSGTYDETTYTTTYSGSGDFLQIEVYSEQGVGTLERGTYEIADDNSFGPMKFKVGAVGMYGDGGTFIKSFIDGVGGEANFITEGTLTIEGEGDATKITLSTPDATYMFTGNIGL